MITSRADLFLNLGCGSTGMPRPLSVDGEPAALLQLHLDPGGVAGHGLVHRVVDHLGEQVVQRLLVGAADVHARPAPHRLQALQDLDVGCGVAVGRLGRFANGTRHGSFSRSTLGLLARRGLDGLRGGLSEGLWARLHRKKLRRRLRARRLNEIQARLGLRLRGLRLGLLGGGLRPAEQIAQGPQAKHRHGLKLIAVSMLADATPHTWKDRGHPGDPLRIPRDRAKLTWHGNAALARLPGPQRGHSEAPG